MLNSIANTIIVAKALKKIFAYSRYCCATHRIHEQYSCSTLYLHTHAHTHNIRSIHIFHSLAQHRRSSRRGNRHIKETSQQDSSHFIAQHKYAKRRHNPRQVINHLCWPYQSSDSVATLTQRSSLKWVAVKSAAKRKICATKI